MKKIILTSALALSILFANAQLKCYPSGNTYLGGTATTPNSLLSVGGAGNASYQAYVYNSATANNTQGVRTELACPTGSNNSYAVVGYIPTNNSGNSFGVLGFSSNASAQTSGMAVGVYGYAQNAQSGYNYGVWGRLVGSNNGAGIFACDDANASLSIGGKYAGYFAGKIRTTNDSPEKPTSGSWTGYSDQRLKKDIVPFTDGLSVLKQINPISYKFNGMGGLPSEKTQIGVIAQDIQKVAPYCVGKGKLIMTQSEAQNFGSDVVETLPADSNGIVHSVVTPLTYNYDGLIYVLINSVKELSAELDALKGTGQRTTGDNSQGKAGAILQVELANNNQVIIYQNEPNPFDGSTVIRYFIPENITGSAFVVFYDMYGKEVNRLEIKEKGFGKIEANTENLASGIYSYSIIANNKVVDTKKMMKAQ